jgi:hypothetical protein
VSRYLLWECPHCGLVRDRSWVWVGGRCVRYRCVPRGGVL